MFLVPLALSSALSFFDGYRTERLSDVGTVSSEMWHIHDVMQHDDGTPDKCGRSLRSGKEQIFFLQTAQRCRKRRWTSMSQVAPPLQCFRIFSSLEDSREIVERAIDSLLSVLLVVHVWLLPAFFSPCTEIWYM